MLSLASAILRPVPNKISKICFAEQLNTFPEEPERSCIMRSTFKKRIDNLDVIIMKLGLDSVYSPATFLFNLFICFVDHRLGNKYFHRHNSPIHSGSSKMYAKVP